MTCELFERKLIELVPSSQQAFQRADQLEAIIPPEDRRRVWRELRLAGFALPGLKLSPRVFLLSAGIILTAVLLVALTWGGGWVLLSLVVFSLLGVGFTRPFAINAPAACQTVYQAACCLTRITPDGYKAGLWTRDEVAINVRQVLAEASGVPAKDIRNDMTMEDLFGP